MDPFLAKRKQLDAQLQQLDAQVKDFNQTEAELFEKKVVRLFSTPTGREVLKGFKEMWVDRMVFDENPYKMAYKAGLSDFTNFIIDTLSVYERGRQ